MGRFLSIVVVLVLAGAGGAYWYATGASRNAGPSPESPASAASDAAAGNCQSHHVAVDTCPFCNPALIAQLGECREHGVPEAVCWICRPKLAAAFKAVDDWCGEHSRPESACDLCAGSIEKFRGRYAKPTSTDANAGAAPLDETSATAAANTNSATPRSQRPPAEQCVTGSQTVRLASTDVARRTGLQFARVGRQAVTHSLTCNAEITYDAGRYARHAPRVAGVIREVRADLGARVSKGDVLAVLDSSELAAAKADYLQAAALVALWEKNREREDGLLQRGISTERDLIEAESKLTEQRIDLSRARQRLHTLGIDDAAIAALAARQDISPVLSVTASFEGIVVERNAVIGENADPSRSLFTIADTRTMWAILDVYESDLREIRIGQPVSLEVEAWRGREFAGRVTWISTEVDHRTRTLKVRAELDNADGLLRANMFGTARTAVMECEPIVVVPRSAVQWDGCCNIVFVRTGETTFQPRKVRLGHETGELYEVHEGLSVDETVVTQGSFLLKTEIMKERIGAGCCPDD